MQPPTMFKSERNISACRALADTTSAETASSSSRGKMSLCRACLVLLGSQDNTYDLCREKDLAVKFLACMGNRDNEFWKAPLDRKMSSNIVLQCICECCYQLVQKFHDFQCMCEESLRNFEKIMLDVNAKGKAAEFLIETPQEVHNNAKETDPIEEIEKVYIIEDEIAKEALGKEKIQQRPRGVRRTMDCHICGRGFYKMSLYEAHMQKHRGEQPYKCTFDNCDKAYARANSLIEHLQKVHENSATSYPCEEPNCNKVFTAERSLNYHIRRSHEKNDDPTSYTHICEKCGKSYGRRSHLTRHQLVHKSKGELQYACDYCVQRFYTDQNLKDHLLRRHSHKPVLRCRRCGRIFESRAALSNHTIKKHAKQRPKTNVKFK